MATIGKSKSQLIKEIRDLKAQLKKCDHDKCIFKNAVDFSSQGLSVAKMNGEIIPNKKINEIVK